MYIYEVSFVSLWIGSLRKLGFDVGAYFNIEIEFLNRLEVSNVPAKLFDQSLFFYDFKKQA